MMMRSVAGCRTATWPGRAFKEVFNDGIRTGCMAMRPEIFKTVRFLVVTYFAQGSLRDPHVVPRGPASFGFIYVLGSLDWPFRFPNRVNCSKSF